MISKERTIEKIKNQELHNQRELKKYGKVSIFSQKELHYYKEVLKDLEVLEILKKHCAMYENVYKGKALVLDYVSKENDKKIKEWLNDK